MALVAEGPPKFCPECGFERPRSDFYARRAKNGRVYAQPVCKEHDVGRFRRWRAENVERYRELQRQKYQRIRQDPERAAIYADWHREYYRKSHGVTPDRRRINSPGEAKAGGKLPAGPFIAWLRTLGSTTPEISRATGVADGMVRALLRGERQSVRIDTVDAALIHANTLTTINDLYPLEDAA